MSDYENLVGEGIDFENYNLQEQIKKYDGYEPAGYQLLCRIYKPVIEEKTKGGIFLTDTELHKKAQDAQITNFVGLVVKIAPAVYKDEERYKLTGKYCQVGDWITFKRAYGDTFCYNGLPTITIDEERILGIVKDPRKISKILNN
jgi:co-chaperonin GroES (HSP10)